MEFKRERMNEVKQKFNPTIFIETGTLMGDTVEYFKNSFKEIYSVELAEDLAERAQKRFANDKHVSIIKGDSGEVLKSLMQRVKEPALCWLDGHYSSEFFVGEEFIKTAKGDKDTPIEEELKVILSSDQKHIILVDDARLFTGNNDYPSITKLKKLVNKYSADRSVKVADDIIYILPR